MIIKILCPFGQGIFLYVNLANIAYIMANIPLMGAISIAYIC
jgi:hypothetical protein